MVPDSQDVTCELIKQPKGKTYAALARQHRLWYQRFILVNRKIKMFNASLTVWMNIAKFTLLKMFLLFQRTYEEK